MAVCDTRSGRLLYNLSASDLKGMTVHQLHLLFKPVPELLSSLRGRRMIFPLTVQPRTSVKDLLEALLGNCSEPLCPHTLANQSYQT